MEFISIVIFGLIAFVAWYFFGGNSRPKNSSSSTSSKSDGNKLYPDLKKMEASSLFSSWASSFTSVDAIMDKFTQLEDVQTAIRQAGMESCNLIFGKTLILYPWF